MLRTLDPGTMGGDAGTVVFVFGMLSVDARRHLHRRDADRHHQRRPRRASSTSCARAARQVIERDHTVILGWSPQIFPIITELVLANANQREPAHRRARRPATRSRWRTRSGSASPTPGRRASSAAAAARSTSTSSTSAVRRPSRSIIVLSPTEGDPRRRRHQDAAGDDQRSRAGATEPYHIVAEMHDARNVEVARLASRGEARMRAGRRPDRPHRRPDLPPAGAVGRLHGAARLRAATRSTSSTDPRWSAARSARRSARSATRRVIGIVPAGGQPQLNPPMDHVLADGDRLIIAGRGRRHDRPRPGHRRQRPTRTRIAEASTAAPEAERDPGPRLEPSQPRSCCASSTVTSRPAREICGDRRRTPEAWR